MQLNKTVATYRRLRESPMWRLLAADSGPVVIGLLQNNLLEGERKVPASILYERLERDLEDLRALGESMPQTAQGYVADWLARGWLVRRFPAGATEEEYELSAPAAEAIHLVRDMVEPRTAVTGSRLATVINQLVRLSEDTDTNPESRLESLLAERERIDRQIEDVRGGRFQTISEDHALERTREIISLADELVADFRRVRDDFEGLNRTLREQIMDESDSRGDVLNRLFAGIDVIAESESGRTFNAFWRLLTDPEQSGALEEAIEALFNREFSRHLDVDERRFLVRLVHTLLDQGGMVHEVLQQFSRSLKQFVQSREYLEQRRINRLIKDAQRAAMALRDDVKATERLDFQLALTGARFRSVSRWVLFDPSHNTLEKGMTPGDAPEIGMASVAALVSQSEIDFRALAEAVRCCLMERSQVSIGEVLERFPAPQGLGSVVGYIALGSRSGVPAAGSTEAVQWRGGDGRKRGARIPLIYFVEENIHALG